MKIQCDVCAEKEASVLCVADDAALCSACDLRVHHANKLAGKHQRFTLTTHPNHQLTLCDICQEKRGMVFCHEDRAILCSECDASKHQVNQHALNHTRFLLSALTFLNNNSEDDRHLQSAATSTSVSASYGSTDQWRIQSFHGRDEIYNSQLESSDYYNCESRKIWVPSRHGLQLQRECEHEHEHELLLLSHHRQEEDREAPIEETHGFGFKELTSGPENMICFSRRKSSRFMSN